MLAFYNWDEVDKEEVAPGLSRKVISGDKIMVVLWEVQPGAEVPLHKHPHEQISYVISGKAEFKVGDEVRIIGPGDLYHIPYQSNLEHGGKTVGDEPFIEIDIFHPIREDFLKKK